MAFLITCPNCGPRLGYEFRYGGEDKGPRPDQEDLSPQAWVEYVHLNCCVAGPTREWWFHRDGCSAWFTIWRDTTTNREVSAPYPGPDPDPTPGAGKGTGTGTGMGMGTDSSPDDSPDESPDESIP